MIESIAQSTKHSVRLICEVLQLPRSSFYHAATPSQRAQDDAAIAKHIDAIFAQHKRRYGYRRICAELSALGIVCAPCRVRRLMRSLGVAAIQPKTFTPKTSDGRADAPSPNLLLDAPFPTRPNEVWAGDITFIPCGEKWLYLAVVIDLCSRRVVGWSLDDNMRSDLVVNAFQEALAARRGTAGLVFHSDRGSQYGSKAFRGLLQNADVKQSMSARANPYHNAWSESFMGTLKAELIQNGRYISLEDARTDLFEFIDGYYNTQRRHSSLDYSTPSNFEAQLALEN
jgi:putative transposase